MMTTFNTQSRTSITFRIGTLCTTFLLFMMAAALSA